MAPMPLDQSCCPLPEEACRVCLLSTTRCAVSMKLSIWSAQQTLQRVHPTIARIIGIFAGIFIMGAHDFLIFYFVHMVLKSLTALFLVNSDILVFRFIRRRSSIDFSHFTFVFLASIISSLFILISYFGFVAVFDLFISPGTIDVEFFKLYALTIISSAISPFAGIVRAKGGNLLTLVALRGRNFLVLIFILAAFLSGIDEALLPYAWLLASLTVSFLVLGTGFYYFCMTTKTGSLFPVDWRRGGIVLRRIVGLSARRTDNRATFLATKGAMSAFLGPFAGLVLKTIRFENRGKRHQYVATIRKRGVVNRFERRIPAPVKSGLEKEHLFRGVLILAVLVLAIVVILRGTLDSFLLLGLLVLASKMMSISLRLLVLNSLVSRGFSLDGIPP